MKFLINLKIKEIYLITKGSIISDELINEKLI